MTVKIRTAGLFLIALLAAALLPSAASGSVVIGSTLASPPDSNGTCGPPCTIAQTVSSSPLKSPVNGVVVSWSTLGGSGTIGTNADLRLRIIRDAGGGSYTAVRSGPTTSIPPSAGHPMITTPVNPGLPIDQNDYVGVDLLGGAIAQRGATGFTYALWQPPLLDGTTRAPDVTAARETLIAATLEADCDNDGLGDETQDTNLSSCPPGTTPIGPAPTLPSGAPATCRGKPATIVGTNGSDARTGSQGQDVIVALGGNDKLSGLAGNDVICGGKGNDTLKGGAGNDFLGGQKGNDKLSGQKGNDKLSGKAGNDKLKGGPGKDTLKGGAGKDEQVQ